MEIKEFVYRMAPTVPDYCKDGLDCPYFYECQEQFEQALDYCPLQDVTADFKPLDEVIR